MGNNLKFSEDGSSFVFVFANGSESMEINSKKEGFAALASLLEKGRISKEELNKFKDEIVEAENLDWDDIIHIGIGISMIPSASPLDFLKLILSKIKNEDKKPVEIACFEVCENCGKHGVIFTKKCFSSDLTSKKEALEVLDNMKNKNFLSSAEFEKVHAEILASSLPEKEE